MKSIILTMLIILADYSISVATPLIQSVPKNMIDGEEITISGSDFTTNPLDIGWTGGKFGLIEQANVGRSPAAVKGWSFNSRNVANVVTTEQHHSGVKSLTCHLVGGMAQNGVITYDPGYNIGFNKDIFISWWVRREHSFNPGVTNGQWKMFRASYLNDITDKSMPQFTMFNWDTTGKTFFVDPGPTTNDKGMIGNAYGYPYPAKDNRWYRIDLQVHTASAHGARDGMYTVSLYDPASGTLVQSKSTGNAVSFNSTDDFYRYFIWQNYIGNGLATQQVWTDDLYVQIGTLSRVELGDKPTWNNCTHREIQVPSEWSSSSIKFTVNEGSFVDGTLAYIFVVDNAGNVSAGTPVCIGESGQCPQKVPIILRANFKP